jgi:hypothetical protein
LKQQKDIVGTYKFKKSTSILAAILMASFISGCNSLGGLQFTDKAGHTYQGQFNVISKIIDVDINSVKYSGFYITDAGTVGNVVYTGHTGRATLSATNGDNMQCEFNYEGLRGIGSCLSAGGESYRFATK